MSVTVNGVDLRAFGCIIERKTFPRLIAERSVLVDIPGAAGGLRVGGTVDAATVTADGYIVAASAAALQASATQLARATVGDVAVGDTDTPDREWHGRLQAGSAISPEVPEAAAVRLSWLCPDPAAVAVAETVLPGADVTLALGDAPTPIRVDVRNVGATNITATKVQVFAGATLLRSFDWSGAVLPGKVWTLDDESYDVRNDGALALTYTTASVFPYADPLEGASRVLVTVTGGTAAVCIRYRNRFRS